jgi:hypothetical protein
MGRLVRIKLDFIVEVPGDGGIPHIDPLDLIEHGVSHPHVAATAILPGSKCDMRLTKAATINMRKAKR